jgi:hypothetical protein
MSEIVGRNDNSGVALDLTGKIVSLLGLYISFGGNIVKGSQRKLGGLQKYGDHVKQKIEKTCHKEKEKGFCHFCKS